MSESLINSHCSYSLFVVMVELLEREALSLPEKWEMRRPESLTPVEFIHLTIDLYGEKKEDTSPQTLKESNRRSEDHVWRNVAI